MMTKTHPFVEYLEGLRGDRGALAALRRGLGQDPGTVPDMYPYVVPWIPEDASPRRQACYYVVAALFAYHPHPGGSGNMGQHFARAWDPQGDNAALERRFTALLNAHPDDLPGYLRQAVSFLKSKGIPVHWHQLLSDVQAWGHPSRYVQQRWARGFWSRATTQSLTKED